MKDETLLIVGGGIAASALIKDPTTGKTILQTLLGNLLSSVAGAGVDVIGNAAGQVEQAVAQAASTVAVAAANTIQPQYAQPVVPYQVQVAAINQNLDLVSQTLQSLLGVGIPGYGMGTVPGTSITYPLSGFGPIPKANSLPGAQGWQIFQ